MSIDTDSILSQAVPSYTPPQPPLEAKDQEALVSLKLKKTAELKKRLIIETNKRERSSHREEQPYGN